MKVVKDWIATGSSLGYTPMVRDMCAEWCNLPAIRSILETDIMRRVLSFTFVRNVEVYEDYAGLGGPVTVF